MHTWKEKEVRLPWDVSKARGRDVSPGVGVGGGGESGGSHGAGQESVRYLWERGVWPWSAQRARGDGRDGREGRGKQGALGELLSARLCGCVGGCWVGAGWVQYVCV